MIDFTIRTQIACPVEEVFAYATDPAKLASWQTNTVSAETLDGGPLALGSRLREVHRAPGGRELTSIVEVAELDPNTSFALRMIEGQLPLDAHIAFDEHDGGTALAFRVSGRPRGAMRLAEPLLTLVLKRQFAAYCETLKRVLEA